MGYTRVSLWSEFDANTILKADADNTPEALTVNVQEVVGRLTGGEIDGIAIGIANDNIVQIDDANAASGEVALFTANGIEGRATGIANTCIVKIDAADVADDEYARFTANGLESRTAAEVAAALPRGITNDALLEVDDADVADDNFCRFTANGIEGLTVAEAITALLAASLPENTAVILDEALSADGKYSGVCFAGTAGAALSYGQVVYFASADSKWELTDADAESTTKPRIAIVTVAATENNTAQLMHIGYIREDDWNWATPGAPLFVDTTTAGGMTETAPTGTGDIVRVVGYVHDANTVFFAPSPVWLKHA